MTKTKVCKTCGKRKSIDMFQIHSSMKDGLRADCKPCRTQQLRNYRATGTTVKNEYEGKSMESLDVILRGLSDGYKKFGFELVKKKINVGVNKN